MLVIRVELWPHGNKHRRKTLGTAVIANDGSGDWDRGNYDVWVGDPKDPHDVIKDSAHSRVEGFPRTRLGPWHLVFKALQSMCDRHVRP